MTTSISSESLSQLGAEKIAFNPKLDRRPDGRTNICNYRVASLLINNARNFIEQTLHFERGNWIIWLDEHKYNKQHKSITNRLTTVKQSNLIDKNDLRMAKSYLGKKNWLIVDCPFPGFVEDLQGLPTLKIHVMIFLL